MDLTERIERRRNHRYGNGLVVDWDALNPAVHTPEPVSREFVFEALLDEIDCIFDGRLPPNVYLWGPPGSGKSAIVTALVSAFQQTVSDQRRTIHTVTRADGLADSFQFTYVDGRGSGSRFKLYHHLLNYLVDDHVPQRGIGTDEIGRRLADELRGVSGMVVVVDHLCEPDTPTPTSVGEYLESFENVRWIGVGRERPAETSAVEIQVPPYTFELIDILSTRGAHGLSQGIDHELAKRLSEWAESNAHDALAALFGAAVEAAADGEIAIDAAHVEAGKAAVPRNGVPIGRVLTLSANKQLVLHALLDRADEDLSIDTTAERIAERTALSQGTVRRYIYELAQIGVLEREEQVVESGAAGRPPSVVVPQFPTLVFERLYESA